MASAGADAYFARPVYLPMDRGTIQMDTSADIPKGYRKDTIKRIRFADVENVATREFSDIENTSPPPRTPPPNSICATKYSQYAVLHKDKQKDSILLNHRTNALRCRDNSNISTGTLFISRDRPSITTQTMATALHNYNTVDITDCVSDHRYPIVDTPIAMTLHNYNTVDITDCVGDHGDLTVITMTIEEERGNQEKINHNLDKYMTIQSKSDERDTDTDKSKAGIQNKTNSHVQFSYRNTLDTNYLQIQNGTMEEQLYNKPKVVPLHIKTESKTGHSPIDSPDDGYATNDSPDDGYGVKDSPDERYSTNASGTGTVSSPFSSSSGSTDLGCSVNGYFKRINLPNGAIKPNSVRESWAVKRKQRLAESHNNTVQEQLRELNIIEEENATRNTNTYQDKKLHPDVMAARSYTRSHDDTTVSSSKNPHTSNEGFQGALNYEVPFIDVSPNDMQRINAQLYVMNGGRGTYNVSQVGSDEMFQANHQVDCNDIKQSLSTNGVEGIENKTNDGSENKLHQTGNRIEKSIRAGGIIREQRNLTTEQSSRREGNTKTELASWDNGYEISEQNKVSCGRFRSQTRNEQFSYAKSDSGNIYIRSSDNEKSYSLNHNRRSSSISSLQAIIELTKSRGGMLETDIVPSSPLEELRVDLFEKWRDKDRNYRNYYGFDEQGERYSRTDLKVNYFQEKKHNTMSGHDNYYRPHTCSADIQAGSQTSSQGSTRDSTENNVPNHENTLSSHTDSKRSKTLEKDTSVKSILFKMLPKMFKSSNMKHNIDTNDRTDSKNIKKADRAIRELPQEARCDSNAEAEYINLGDLPQYSLANVESQERLKTGHFSSLEHLHWKPVFASSRDIKNLFSNHDKTFDSLNGPERQRNSFRTMPLSYRHTVSPNSVCSDAKPRTMSINVSCMRGQEIRNSGENLVPSLKNVDVLNRARQVQSNSDFVGSTPVGTMVQATSRTRLDSDSSGKESKLSTLV